jgi:transcriptional regulator with PAS, ATPase and Fis domain
VRLIAATNRNLSQMVSNGLFREDLYYRLNVVSIEMPALRERKEDVQQLATFFLRRFAGELKKRVDGLGTDAQKLLMRYNWRNIRDSGKRSSARCCWRRVLSSPRRIFRLAN